jgi:hypothetical protein
MPTVAPRPPTSSSSGGWEFQGAAITAAPFFFAQRAMAFLHGTGLT